MFVYVVGGYVFVVGFDYYCYVVWFECFVDVLGYLCGEFFLYLEVVCIVFYYVS